MLVGLGSLASPCSFRWCEDAETEDMAESMDEVRGMSLCRDLAELRLAVGLELRALLSEVMVVAGSGDRIRLIAGSSPASKSCLSCAAWQSVLGIVAACPARGRGAD